MPSPREQPPSNRKSRRQESMPAGWLWVVILLLLVSVMYFALGFNSPGVIDYTEFMRLAEVKDEAKKPKYFSKVIIRGGTRMIGEFREGTIDALEKPIKDKVRYGKIEAAIPEPERVSGNVTKVLTQYGVSYRSEDDAG